MGIFIVFDEANEALFTTVLNSGDINTCCL